MDDADGPVRVVLTPQCRAYMVTFTDGRPGLVINYGGRDLEFRPGDDPQAAERFALDLLGAAYSFAGRCFKMPGGRGG